MPTLFRFLAVLALLAGMVYGGMLALTAFVRPATRQMIQTIPPSKLNQ